MASRARIHKLDAYKRQRKHQSLGTDYYKERDKPSQRRGKLKSTIERRGPPALDPPILLLAVGRLLVVVLAGRVVVVVVATVVVNWGGSLRGSVVCRH